MNPMNDDFFMKTYHRLPLTFTHGEGARLFDTAGKSYIDWTSGIAVNVLGHNHPALTAAITEQAHKLIHVSNYFQTDVTRAFAAKLVAAAGMKRVFLCNSGAEANEGAVKIARKYALKKYGERRHTIVTLTGSFHGRTITTLAATGQPKFHTNFGPFTEGFIHTPPGDSTALDKALDPDKVCAFLLEPIQGESGVIIMEESFVKTAAKLCAERDILLMFDEVQSGVGRAGTFLAEDFYGVKGDVVTLAKGLAGGIPVGAVLAGEKTADVLETGDHGSTFGGNALAAACGNVVLDTLGSPGFYGEITRKGERIQAGIKAWKHPKVQAVRGRGLIIACDLTADAWPVLEAMIAQAGKTQVGLIALSAGVKTLRFLPPFIISDDEIDEGLRILKAVLDK